MRIHELLEACLEYIVCDGVLGESTSDERSGEQLGAVLPQKSPRTPARIGFEPHLPSLSLSHVEGDVIIVVVVVARSGAERVGGFGGVDG